MDNLIISQNLQESPLQNTNSGTPVQNGTTTPKTPGEYALMYATRFAWRVFPVAPRTKNPLINDWPNKATTNTDQIEDWWARWPSANIGLATGDGLLVADFDGEEGLKLLARLNGYTRTPAVKTRRGKHLYYRVSPEVEAQLRNHVGAYHGLDFRTKGGYVLLPPSVHESGVRYGWEVQPDVPLLDAPSLLLLPKTQRLWLGSTLASAENGNRNNSGFGLACQLRDNNVVKGDAKRVMEIYQQMVDDPTDPYTLDEALRTLDSAYSSAKREPAHGERLDDFAYTGLGNADRLVHRHGDNIKYTEGLGWLVWEGDRWTASGSRVRLHMQGITREMAHRAVDIKGEEARKAAVAWAMKSQEDNRINAAVSLASDMAKVRADATEFDNPNDWLLGVSNATIELRTGRVREHRREDYITKLANVNYDSAAECPQWLAFLDRIMGGNQELVTFLKRAVGYSLTPSVQEQCLFFLYGTGNNGKTTFVETVMRLLGDLAGTVDSEFLMMTTYHGGNADAPSPTIAGLKGKRMIVASEIEQGARWAESKLKKLTGDDTLRGRHLHRESVEFKPTHKLWIFGNYKPIVRGTELGFWRRMHLIPFTVTIPKNEIDKRLPGKLAAELPGILNWGLEGLREWQQHGLPAVAPVEAAVKTYQKEMDIVQQFIEAMCEAGEGYKEPPGNLYDAFRSWCQQQGEKAGYNTTSNAFGRRLTELGYKGDDRGRYRYGIKLQLTTDEE